VDLQPASSLVSRVFFLVSFVLLALAVIRTAAVFGSRSSAEGYAASRLLELASFSWYS
jgi:hypothetical protein